MAYDAHLADAKRAFADAKSALDAELRAYPTPVSGCDAQYVHLISLRNAATSAITALEHLPFVATPRKLSAESVVEQR